ncbi:16522_t:CDS:2, partial [Gigaspora rosea]
LKQGIILANIDQKFWQDGDWDGLKKIWTFNLTGLTLLKAKKLGLAFQSLQEPWILHGIGETFRSMLGVKNFAKTCQALKEFNLFFPREEAPLKDEYVIDCQNQMALIMLERPISDDNRKRDWFFTSTKENSSKEIYRVSKKSKERLVAKLTDHFYFLEY